MTYDTISDTANNTIKVKVNECAGFNIPFDTWQASLFQSINYTSTKKNNQTHDNQENYIRNVNGVTVICFHHHHHHRGFLVHLLQPRP